MAVHGRAAVNPVNRQEVSQCVGHSILSIENSALPERAGNLLSQRVQEVLQWRPLVGLDENLRRHARNELETFEVLELVLLDRGTDEVVGLIGLLLFPREVRTDMCD